jgi:hypothetical protein
MRRFPSSRVGGAVPKWGQRRTRDVDKNEAQLRHQIFVVDSIFLVW